MVKTLLHSNRKLIAFSVLSGVVSGLCGMGLIYIINLTLQNNNTQISTLIWQFFVLLFFSLTTGLMSQLSLNALGEKAIFEIRKIICRQVLTMPLRKIEETGSGKIYSTLSYDAQSISATIQSLPHIFINGASLIGGLIYLAWLSQKFFFICLAFVLIGVATYQALTQKSMKYFNKSSESSDTLFEHFKAVTSGIKELKLSRSRRINFLAQDLEETGKVYLRNNIKGLGMFSIATQWGQLLFFLLIGALLFSRSLVGQQSSEILIGSVLTVVYLIGPLGVVLSLIPTFGRMKIATERIKSLGTEVSDTLGNAERNESQSLPSLLTWSIEVSAITFTYPGNKNEVFSLGPINFTLKPGEITFLIGGNGSGKSTFLKLLTGLYVPDTGIISINKNTISTEAEREAYRQLFSTVFSDYYLFKRLPQPSEMQPQTVKASVYDYLKQLELGEKVSICNGEFSTVDLSQGQRKRLALLSAYLEDRPVYIFDEWAADQDPHFKEIFYAQILPTLKERGKAVLAVTHDDRYFEFADRIVKLDSGKLEEYS
jgi:putative ATP-binding cassette transporter